MDKSFQMLFVLFISGLLLTACGNGDTEPTEEIKHQGMEENINETSSDSAGSENENNAEATGETEDQER